jgi:hypothetical protein
LAIYNNLPRLNSLDILFTILSTLLASLALLPLANLAGGQLLGKQRIKV